LPIPSCTARANLHWGRVRSCQGQLFVSLRRAVHGNYWTQ